MKGIAFVATVLCVSVAAQGAMTLEIRDMGLLGVQDAGGNDLAYMVLTVYGSAAEHPNTFTGSITGPLHQAWGNWSWSSVKTPTWESADYPPSAEPSIDSHFIPVEADLIVITAPDEDMGTPYGVSVDGYFDLGYGTFLSGEFGDTTASGETWDVAYLVGTCDPGTCFHVEADLASAEGTEAAISADYCFPEPATLSLLGLGGALLLRRMRL
jgi:hypothetical protein